MNSPSINNPDGKLVVWSEKRDVAKTDEFSHLDLALLMKRFDKENTNSLNFHFSLFTPFPILKTYFML